MFQPDKLADLIAKPAHDPRSLAGFTAWLETKPSGEKYDWWSCHNCAMAQYAEEHGFVGELLSLVLSNEADPFSTYGETCGREPHTFGAALERARAYARAAHNEVR